MEVVLYILIALMIFGFGFAVGGLCVALYFGKILTEAEAKKQEGK